MRRISASVVCILFVIVVAQFLSAQSQRSTPMPNPSDMLETLRGLSRTLDYFNSPFATMLPPTRDIARTREFAVTATQRALTPRATSVAPTRLPTLQVPRPSNVTRGEPLEERNVLFRFDQQVNLQDLQVVTLLILAAWFGLLAALVWVGIQLNNVMVRAIRRSVQGGALALTSTENILEKLYCIVVIALSASYFLSIPVLLLFCFTFFVTFNPVIALNGARIVIFVITSFVEYLCLRTMLVALVSLWDRTQFSQKTGIPRQKSEAFWRLNDEVAAQVGVKPATTLAITPMVQMHLRYEGSFADVLDDQQQNALDIGLGGLHRLTQTQLRALLAGEYLSLSFGKQGQSFDKRVLIVVQLMLSVIVKSFEKKNLLYALNPVYNLYLLLTRGYLKVIPSAFDFRAMDIDRKVAEQYGSNNYHSALLQEVASSIEFEILMNREIDEAQSEGRTLHNLYRIPPLNQAERSKLFDQVNVMVALPQALGSISLGDRLKLISGLPEKWFMSADGFGETPAVNLLDDLAEQEVVQTREMQFYLNLYGSGKRQPSREIPKQ